jgi:hypothetical protein
MTEGSRADSKMFAFLSTTWAKAKNVVGAVPAVRDAYMVADRHLHLIRDQAWTNALRSDPRYQDHRSVVRHGFKVCSQHEEDGILEAIFGRIGEGSRRFVEIGVGNGLENNTAYLLHKGWAGAWVDGDPANAHAITHSFARLLAERRLSFREVFVTAEKIEVLLRQLGAGDEPDLLSIDIDGNEWWVWRALHRFRPRVVVVEYNAGLGPSLPWVMPYNPNFRHPGTRAHGASLKAFEKLAADMGYRLVGCNWTGVNAFFVRTDLTDDERFPANQTAEYHYEPPRYYIGPFFGGYAADPREFDGGWPPAGGLGQ